MKYGKIAWSKAKALNSLKFSPEDFKETLDGGQSFCWYETKPLCFEGIFGNNPAKLSLDEQGNVLLSCPNSCYDNELESKVLHYLDTETDYNKLRKELYLIGDKNLNIQLDKRPYLRILNQPIDETIMSFICSSSKRIVQIKQCVFALRKHLGKHLLEDYYAMPTFESIANADIEILKECKLGFRAAYLKKTAQKILNDKFDTNALLEMPYVDAKKYLVSLSGIGEKVADCILLFGANRPEAFPVDTWIIKSMSELYNVEKPNEIRAFAKEHFGKYAGYAQQLLFAAS